MSDHNEKPAQSVPRSNADNATNRAGSKTAEEQARVASPAENANQPSTTGETGKPVRKSSSSEARR